MALAEVQCTAAAKPFIFAALHFVKGKKKKTKKNKNEKNGSVPEKENGSAKNVTKLKVRFYKLQTPLEHIK